jgi:2-alkenal reductase
MRYDGINLEREKGRDFRAFLSRSVPYVEEERSMNRQERNRFALMAGLGCLIFLVLLAVIIGTFLFLPFGILTSEASTNTNVDLTWPEAPGVQETQAAIPTFTPSASSAIELVPSSSADETAPPPSLEIASLSTLYTQLNPGVVNIQVYAEREGLSGQGAGSGFILDETGHIVTNNHVVADARQITVIFYNNIEKEAEVIGTDDDSDLAVIRVDNLPEGVHPLPLGDSSQVKVGEWVVAIGNPFGQQSSMSVGIISAVGRTIPSGATPFDISEVIQTDAAINPGNSGGPLLNLQGEVIGVNAQIAAGPALVNSGVGFAIPINIVRRVAPVLIESGSYQWPWLGIQGGNVNIGIMEANNLESQQGAYIDQVAPNGPADEAGLRGTSGLKEFDGVEVPVGGDVVIAIDNEPVVDFSDLLAEVALRNPDETVQLTILRDGQEQQVTVELEPRP